jgi:small subunit ribosomal protein S5
MAKKEKQKNAEETDKVPEDSKSAVESDNVAPIVSASDVEKDKIEITKSDEDDIKGVKVKKEYMKAAFDKEAWKPRTSLGLKVKSGEINDIDFILDNGYKLLEPEIVDVLLPNMESDLLMVGQSKGKFGGGQRRAFKQTQKKTMEGNKPHFSTLAILGNKDGYFGFGIGRSKETVPAREKAGRLSKLSIRKILRGCGSWECNCGNPHTIPFKVEGKSGSVIVQLLPAPKGTGLCIEKECSKILAIAGIKDVWSKTRGNSSTKLNLLLACIDALDKLVKTRVSYDQKEKTNIVSGKIKAVTAEEV